jgi:glucose-1-phosphate cytidylyltransferase
MKVVLLAGGLGTRLSEQTTTKPKPMVEVGGMPILWHIMNHYSYYGHNDFIICLGYKGHVIKEFFSNYFLNNSDVTFDLENNNTSFHSTNSRPWKVTLVNTGDLTMTGGRLKKVKKFLKQDEPFFMTYGDGVSDIDLNSLLKYHLDHGKLATLSAVLPKERFGVLDINFSDNTVNSFKEKASKKESFINGGFFVLNPKVLDYIDGDEMPFESDPLENLARDKELKSFIHKGFWQCMDNLSDMRFLENLWNDKKAPWKKWD